MEGQGTRRGEHKGVRVTPQCDRNGEQKSDADKHVLYHSFPTCLSVGTEGTKIASDFLNRRKPICNAETKGLWTGSLQTRTSSMQTADSKLR